MTRICIICLCPFLVSPAFSQHLASYFKTKTIYQPSPSSIQTDGSGNILVTGGIGFLNGEPSGSIVMLDQNGKAVPSFKKVIGSGGGRLKVLPNGKMLFLGNYTTANNTRAGGLVRFNSDGSLDAAFTCEIPAASILDFAVQSTGKIVVTGMILYKGYLAVARLNESGVLDETFPKISNIPVLSGGIAIAPDNSIYLIESQIVKLSPDGVQDNSYSIGTGPDKGIQSIRAINVLSTGKLIVVGAFNAFNGTPARGIVRLNENGTVDPAFNVGVGPDNEVRCMFERANKNIVIGGTFSSFNQQPSTLVELKPDGTPQKIVAPVNPATVAAIAESNGKIVFTGTLVSSVGIEPQYVTELNEDYSVNTSFNPLLLDYGSDSHVMDVDPQGRVFVGGRNPFTGTTTHGTPVFRKFFRLTPTGEYDGSFSSNDVSGDLFTILVQDDGKILLSTIAFINGTLNRLNADGTKDNTLNIGTGPKLNSSQIFFRIIKQRGTKLYMSGQFDSYNETPTTGMVILNLDGSISQTFSGPAGTQIRSFDIQSTGKVVAIVDIPPAGGIRKIIRFNADGTLDNTFPILTANGNVTGIAVDGLDRVYLGGDMSMLNTTAVKPIARLLADGNVDQSFILDTGFSGTNIRSIVVLQSGNIAVAGSVNGFTGVDSPGLAFIDPTGQRVLTPGVKLGAGSFVNNLVYRNNALWISGEMIDPETTDSFGLGKITFATVAPPAAPDQLQVTLDSEGTFKISWTDKSDNESAFVSERSTSPTDGFLPLESVVANTVSTKDASIQANVTYYYRVRAMNDGGDSGYSNVGSLKWIPAIPPVVTPPVVTPPVTVGVEPEVTSMTVYPVPAQHVLYLTGYDPSGTFQLVNNTGARVSIYPEVSSDLLTLNLNDVTPGMYVLWYVGAKNQTVLKRILVSK